MKEIFLHISLLFLMLLLTVHANGQNVDRRPKSVPDTLKVADRFSVHSNAIDWLLLLPNIGFEYELRNVEWNHWSVGAKFRYNWQTQHTFAPAQVYNIAEARLETRYYWRMRTYYDSEAALNKIKKKSILNRLFSVSRDSIIKHPNTTYYRGAYAAFTKYSLLLFSKSGHQGVAVSAGATFGIIKPLYQFANGQILNLDLGISAGLCVTKNDEYGYDRESNCYPLLKHNNWRIVPFPVINEVRLSLVYSFGTRPITQKYRWRYDVDAVFQDSLNARFDREQVRIRDEEEKRQFMNGLEEHFQQIFDKVYREMIDEKQSEKGNDNPEEKTGNSDKKGKRKEDGQ